MTLNIAEIFGGVIIALICLIPVKELKKEYLPLITSALSVILLGVAFKRGLPLFDYIKGLSTEEGDAYFSIVFRCFGIATVTQLVSDMCTDFGASSVSSKVSFVGKIGVLMTCIPLVEKLFSLVEGLL